MNVLISIITPVYNAEKFLLRVAESVLAQGLDDWEWLLVDDGSTDDSGRLCDELAARDPRIEVFHRSNSGPGKSKDYALSQCSGRFVTFLDADDGWLPETLQEILALFEQYPDVEMVRFPVYAVAEDGRKTPFHNVGDFEISEGNREIFSLWCRDMQKIAGFMPGKIFRRELIGDVRVPDMRYNEDAYFMTDVLARCRKIAFSNSGGYLYFQHEQSICHQRYSREKLFDELAAEMRIFRRMADYANFDNEFCHVFSLFTLKMLGWMRDGWFDDIEQTAPEALRFFPSWKALWNCDLSIKSKTRMGLVKLLGWRGGARLFGKH